MSNYVVSTYGSDSILCAFPRWKMDEERLTLIWEKKEMQYFGYSFVQQDQTYPRARLSFSYEIYGKSYIYELDNLFSTNRGQKGKVWVPSWQKDLNITANIAAADTHIHTTDIDFGTYYSSTAKTGWNIFIYKNQTNWYARKITEATDSGGETLLTLSSALGSALTTSEIKMICFLYLCRFDTSKIEWKYIAPDLASVDLYFSEIVGEYT